VRIKQGTQHSSNSLLTFVRNFCYKLNLTTQFWSTLYR